MEKGGLDPVVPAIQRQGQYSITGLNASPLTSAAIHEVPCLPEGTLPCQWNKQNGSKILSKF